MTAAPAVLLAVAAELAKSAKDSLPKLQDGERIQREWLADGIYYRETQFNGEVFRETMLRGETFISQYDFKQRKSRRVAVVKK